jgi:hypothetical protein
MLGTLRNKKIIIRSVQISFRRDAISCTNELYTLIIKFWHLGTDKIIFFVGVKTV